MNCAKNALNEREMIVQQVRTTVCVIEMNEECLWSAMNVCRKDKIMIMKVSIEYMQVTLWLWFLILNKKSND